MVYGGKKIDTKKQWSGAAARSSVLQTVRLSPAVAPARIEVLEFGEPIGPEMNALRKAAIPQNMLNQPRPSCASAYIGARMLSYLSIV